jgi:hypothetical protein
MNKYLLAVIATILVTGVYKIMTKASINVRNNNPLNIRFSDNNDWQGQVGQSGGVVKFGSVEYGFRAAYLLIRRYQEAHNLTSLTEIIEIWAPAEDDNHTENYINYLADKLNKWVWTDVERSEVPELLFFSKLPVRQ